MKWKSAATAVVSAIVLTMTVAPASAQERAAGVRLVYDVKVSGQGGQMGAGRTLNLSLALAIDRVEPDGSAHANVSISGAGMPANANFGFGATISPAGAIIPKYDPSIKPHVGMSEAEALAIAQNQAAQSFATTLRPINAFAIACAQRGTLRVGDSWHAEMDLPFVVDAIYTVTGQRSQSGRNQYLVSVKSAATTPNPIAAQGSYDSTAHFVSTLHSTMTNANGETETTDFVLHQ